VLVENSTQIEPFKFPDISNTSVVREWLVLKASYLNTCVRVRVSRRSYDLDSARAGKFHVVKTCAETRRKPVRGDTWRSNGKVRDEVRTWKSIRFRRRPQRYLSRHTMLTVLTWRWWDWPPTRKVTFGRRDGEDEASKCVRSPRTKARYSCGGAGG